MTMTMTDDQLSEQSKSGSKHYEIFSRHVTVCLSLPNISLIVEQKVSQIRERN